MAEIKKPITQYLAHSKNSEGQDDPVLCHLRKVANQAAEFAKPFGASREAELAGLLHDLGKYGDLFQARLAGKERGIDHWSSGAWQALLKYKSNGMASALAIQGHHIGLQKAAPDALKQLVLPETLCVITSSCTSYFAVSALNATLHTAFDNLPGNFQLEI